MKAGLYNKLLWIPLIQIHTLRWKPIWNCALGLLLFALCQHCQRTLEKKLSKGFLHQINIFVLQILLTNVQIRLKDHLMIFNSRCLTVWIRSWIIYIHTLFLNFKETIKHLSNLHGFSSLNYPWFLSLLPTF